MENEIINFSTLICDTINIIFFKIFSSIDNTIYSTLDNILWINTDIIKTTSFIEIFGNLPQNGFLLIANSLIIGIIIFYVLNLAISNLIYSKIDSPYQFIFKCIIFISCTNSSLWICKNIIYLIELVTNSIREIGYIINGCEINFSNLIEQINPFDNTNIDSFNIFSLDGILKFISTIEIIYILINYSIRYVMCKIFVLLSPFAFISLIFNKTDGLFKGWLKQFLILLLTQVLVAITMILAFSFDIITNDALSELLFLATILIISKSHLKLKNFLEYIYSYSHNTLKKYV